MTVIAAKPTVYRETRFRSRLEARWAVFFDALGYEWVYEPLLPNLQLSYQPDFLLHKPRQPSAWNQLVEIKPWPGETNDWASLATYLNTVSAEGKYGAVAKLTDHRMVLIIGTPGVWGQGRLTAYGSVAVIWYPNHEPSALYEWGECSKCGGVNLWPDGLPACCDRDLPTGRLYQAFGRVRDHSYEDAT